jgi:hypothetical protein
MFIIIYYNFEIRTEFDSRFLMTMVYLLNKYIWQRVKYKNSWINEMAFETL